MTKNSTSKNNNNSNTKFLELVQNGEQLQVNAVTELGAKFISFDDTNKKLALSFPVNDSIMNPYGIVQGGFLMAVAEITIGSLSYLLDIPGVTKQLNAAFIRPVKKPDQEILAKAYVIEQTKKHLFLRAELKKKDGKIILLAHATLII